MSVKIRVAVTAVLVAMAAASGARADDGPWEVRLRALYLDPSNSSDAIPAIAVPKDAVHINSKVIPDLDFEYRFTPHWSSELLLTYPQSQTVKVTSSVLGPAVLGTFKHLPPTLTAKYNFMPDSAFQPYVGAGVNLTIISDVHLAVPTVGALKLDSTSIGPAAQAGFDYRIADHWYLSADVKWVMIRSDVKLNGTKLTEARIDPFLFGIGVGYRFGGSASGAAAPVAAAAVAPPPPPAAAPPPPPPPPPPPAVAPPPPPPPPVSTTETVLKGVNFKTGSAVLEPSSRRTLDELVANIERCDCGTVQIRGYTDSVGKPAANQKLSERRAQAVKKYLVAHGIPAEQLNAQGLGASNFVASNDEAAGRAENRRVTVQASGTARR